LQRAIFHGLPPCIDLENVNGGAPPGRGFVVKPPPSEALGDGLVVMEKRNTWRDTKACAAKARSKNVNVQQYLLYRNLWDLQRGGTDRTTLCQHLSVWRLSTSASILGRTPEQRCVMATQ